MVDPLVPDRASARRLGRRAFSGQIEPFDRDDFAPWLGALRMAMLRVSRFWKPAKIRNDAKAQKNPACGGANRLPGFVATLA
ncbi:MAG: hypothetical protein V3U99_05600, partial [Alphaproteobacteria bacterium]